MINYFFPLSLFLIFGFFVFTFLNGFWNEVIIYRFLKNHKLGFNDKYTLTSSFSEQRKIKAFLFLTQENESDEVIRMKSEIKARINKFYMIVCGWHTSNLKLALLFKHMAK